MHISTYNAKNPPYSKWFRELRHILDKDPHNQKIANNLTFEQGAGNKKCSGCYACPKVQQNKFFKSTNTKRKYQIQLEDPNVILNLSSIKL